MLKKKIYECIIFSYNSFVNFYLRCVHAHTNCLVHAHAYTILKRNSSFGIKSNSFGVGSFTAAFETNQTIYLFATNRHAHSFNNTKIRIRILNLKPHKRKQIAIKFNWEHNYKLHGCSPICTKNECLCSVQLLETFTRPRPE